MLQSSRHEGMPVTSYRRSLSICIAIFVFSFLLAWTFGGTSLYPWDLLLGHSTPIEQHILLSIRLPRVICACLVGAGLSAAGVLTQAYFRNPLASPSVIGISSGGMLGAICAFYLGWQSISIWVMPFFAFCGAVASSLIVLTISKAMKNSAIEQLLLIGFALNAILSAISSLLLSLSLKDFDKAPAMMNWMLGTLAGRSWDHVLLGFIPILVAIILSYRLSYRLNLLGLGHEVAQTLGVSLVAIKYLCIGLVSFIVATTVSIGGLLPFLGLVVPHVSRLIVGPDNKRLLLVSCINGMTLLLLADLLGRTAIAPSEIQVGVLISLLGAPFFLWLLLNRRRDGVGL